VRAEIASLLNGSDGSASAATNGVQRAARPAESQPAPKSVKPASKGSKAKKR
jgi:hypothetical protein